MQEKKCFNCGTVKSIENFSKCKRGKYGVGTRCKSCRSALHKNFIKTDEYRRKQREFRKQYVLCNPEKARISYRRTKLKSIYGISLEEYNEILYKQNCGCAICGMNQENSLDTFGQHLSVDHDHNTQKIRGILCSNCNRGIGFLKDNKDIILKAYRYIAR